MKTSMRFLVIAAVAALAHDLPAQVWTLTLSQNGSKAESDELKTDKVNLVDGHVALVVQCGDTTDCQKVEISLIQGGTPKPMMTAKSPKAASVQLAAADITAPDAKLEVRYGNTLRDYLIGAGGGGGNNGPIAEAAPDLATMLATQCEGKYTAAYNRKENRGTIVVTPLGVVLARPPEPFDEDDVVEVRVVGDKELLPKLVVTRKSPFRQVREVRVVGEEVEKMLRFAAKAPRPCSERTFELTDFDPGRGEVEIAVAEPAKTLGSFDFQVDPLYTGMFSFAAVWTKQTENSYVIVPRADKRVIALGNAGDHDMVYSVFFTPFVWGKRDLQKPPTARQWYQHINPTLGMALSNPGDQAFAGVTIDLPGGIGVSGGEHFRRVSVLAGESGLAPGSEFSGTADQLPLVKRWEHDHFVAFSVDLRVAVNLIKQASGGGTGK